MLHFYSADCCNWGWRWATTTSLVPQERIKLAIKIKLAAYLFIAAWPEAFGPDDAELNAISN